MRKLNAKRVAKASLGVLAIWSIWLPTPSHARARYIEFDVPGAASTTATAINNFNVLTGRYQTQDGQYHGFVRTRRGKIKTFDVSGSQTVPTGINDAGSVTGHYVSGFGHGFVRAPDGIVTLFDVPGAAGTAPSSINSEGVIAGSWYTDDYTYHGFIRHADGSIATFDPPASTSTMATSINGGGIIVGYYSEGSTTHSFLRRRNGQLLEFDVQGADHQLGTRAYSIDDENNVVGYYEGPDYGEHAFLRMRHGHIASFDVPHATEPFPLSVAYASTGGDCSCYIAGQAVGPYYNYVGFLRFADGTIEAFKAPGAGSASYEGTEPAAVNSLGSIAGSYMDSNNVIHAFLRIQR